MFWLWIILASMVGGFAGVVLMSLMFVGKEADEEAEKAWKGFDEEV